MWFDTRLVRLVRFFSGVVGQLVHALEWAESIELRFFEQIVPAVRDVHGVSADLRRLARHCFVDPVAQRLLVHVEASARLPRLD